MKLTIVIIAVAAALLVTGCNGEKPPAPKEEDPQPEPVDVNSITIPPDLGQRITVGRPMMVDLTDKLEVPSQVEVDQERLAHIGSYVTGRIVELYVMLGDSVDVGTPLARISSPGLTQAQLAYLNAASQTKLAEKAVERAHHLLAADGIALAEVERRESELQVVRAEMSAAKDQLRLLGVDNHALKEMVKQGHILPSVAIRASRSGIVIKRNVIIGQVVQPADELFQVADLSSVWVVGDVPEQVVGNVEVGQHVEIHVPALRNVDFEGLIIFVADTVNPLTRTVEVKTDVANPHRKLKPAMLATMHIKGNPHKSLVVPETAVVREANRDYVFLVQGDNRFLRIPVELGPEVAGMRPVLKGLAIEQNIVMNGGAFHLDNERSISELK